MEEAIENQESVLVQSMKAQNRACFVIAAFIMRRFRWSLLKTLEFVNSRRPDLEMRPSFLQQLSMFENRLYQKGLGAKTSRWTELSDNTFHLENEEWILRNTYLNSQMAPLVDLSGVNLAEDKNFKIRWTDLTKPGAPLAIENEDEKDLVNLQNPSAITRHKEPNHAKSAIKGSRNESKKQQASSKSKFLAKTSMLTQAPPTQKPPTLAAVQPSEMINFHPQN